MAVTKADLAENVAEELGVTRELALSVIETALDNIRFHLGNGIDVDLRGFGIFTTKLAPKMTVKLKNMDAPKTIPATWRAKFRAYKKLRDAVAEP